MRQESKRDKEKLKSGFYYQCAGDCQRIKKYNGTEDSGTVYGCADPESPEPYDPDFFCRRCATKEYKRIKENLLELIKKGATKSYKSWWEVPNFYVKAVEEAGWQFEGHDLVYKPK